MRKNNKMKRCPFLDRECEGDDCALFNESFERCEWGLMTYNLWLVSNGLKQRFEPEDR